MRREEVVKRLEEEKRRIAQRLEKIKHKLAIMSGKGGVGKTTVAVNLAVELARRGLTVGLLDADIHGPNVPKMLGVGEARPVAGPPGIFPVLGPLNLRVMSMAFLLEDEKTPVIWRGPLKTAAIRQFLSDVVWGPLDWLVVDLPPGTGDEPLTIMQLIPLDGVVIVTTPQEVALLDVKKAISMALRLGVRVVGVVENMSVLRCPRCGAEIYVFGRGGGERAAREFNVPFLGGIPLDPGVVELGDKGKPVSLEKPDSEVARAIRRIADRVVEIVEKGAQ